MSILNPSAGPDQPAAPPADGDAGRLGVPAVRLFAAALGILLLGYMFLGRGFAHLGIPPLYVGEMVLAVCIVATGFALWRNGVRVAPSRMVWLLVGLMVLGALRTIPYLGQYGLDALRDATLWGYAAFALMVYVLADRELVLRGFRIYGWVVPVFALWLPISYNVFAFLSRGIDPTAQGTSVPLIFFKGGDMAVHIVGTIAFLVLGGRGVLTRSSVAWRVIIAIPLVWTALVAGAANRGALLTMVFGILLVVALAPRSRNWLPLLLGTVALAVTLGLEGVVRESAIFTPSPTQTPTATASPRPTPSPSPTPLPTRRPAASPSGAPGPTRSGSPSAGPSTRPTLTPAPRSSPSGSPGEVAVENPGFELGPLDAGVEGWTPYGVGTYRIVGEGGFRNSRFVEIDNTGGAYQATLTSSRFAVSPAEDIEVSLRAKAIRGRPSLEIYVNWYDRSGDKISSVFVTGLPTVSRQTWQGVLGLYPRPPGASRAEVLLWEAAGDAAIGIDEVTVRFGDFIPEPTPAPSVASESPDGPRGRPPTLEQLIENILSVFGSTSDQGLEGTRQFRLAWWGTIINYTVFGDYFWTGKGFGINLADSDGFQSNIDHSLRAPHNSHITVLARMGVPGFVIWLLLQAAFGIGLLRATLAFRRARDTSLAAIGGWLTAYWFAMMINTSFDPYLEGPQGGIWFWAVFGMGLVVMRLVPRRHPT